jgi:hypothetical protein
VFDCVPATIILDEKVAVPEIVVGATRTMLEVAESWRLLLAFTAIDANEVTTAAPPVDG